MNVWQLDNHKVTAPRPAADPGRLLTHADVAETVLTAITHMYERYDGRASATACARRASLPGRVVALCDSVADLTLNPATRWAASSAPSKPAAASTQTPKVFDPTLLAHFSRLLVERRLDAAFLSEQRYTGVESCWGSVLETSRRAPPPPN